MLVEGEVGGVEEVDLADLGVEGVHPQRGDGRAALGVGHRQLQLDAVGVGGQREQLLKLGVGEPTGSLLGRRHRQVLPGWWSSASELAVSWRTQVLRARTDAAANGLPTRGGPAHPQWVNFGLDEPRGASGSWRPLTEGRGADALLGHGTALGMAAWSLAWAAYQSP